MSFFPSIATVLHALDSTPYILRNSSNTFLSFSEDRYLRPTPEISSDVDSPANTIDITLHEAVERLLLQSLVWNSRGCERPFKSRRPSMISREIVNQKRPS